MRLSEADKKKLRDAENMPADVLLLAVRSQAGRCLLSEAHCLEMASAYTEAATTARVRRLYPETADVIPRSANLSISPQE